jgi:hypothetical protein
VEIINFLGLNLDNQITWKNHIQLFLRKLNSACFLMRRICSVLNIDSLKLVYFAEFHLIVKYGIIFWRNQQNVNKMFILQKRTLRIMLGLGCRSSCGSSFQHLEILTVPCFFIGNVCDSTRFKTNFSVHSIHSRQKKHRRKLLVKFN